MESEFERLRKKVENYPSASAYNRLAELARLNQDDAEAERICQRCAKEFPRNGQAYVILAEIALAAGRKDDGLKHLHNAVERDTRSYAGHRLLADAYAADGNTGKALHHLRQILVFKPNDPTAVQKMEALSRAAGGAAAAPAMASSMRRSTPPPLGTATLTPGALATIPAKAAASPSTRTAAFTALCAEPGVRGAVVADNQGRVVVTHGLDGKADLLAALAAEITGAATATAKQLGQEQLASWLIEGERGQVLAFKRDQVLTLAVLADTGVRAALLELRARQALIDLGGT